VFNKTDLEEIMDGGSGADNADGQHTHAEAGIIACSGEGQDSIGEFDDSTGAMTCKKSTQTTISGGVTAADFLVYKAGSFQDVEMSGDAEMDEDGVVTLDPALNFATTGTITGAISVIVESSGATDVLVATETVGKMFVASYATGPMVYTLPDVSIGLSACFYDEEGDGITIDVNGSEIIILDGTPLTGGYTIDSPGAAGDFVCVLGISATQWITLGRSGTWVDGGAT
jgi:hypothetical protein